MKKLSLILLCLAAFSCTNKTTTMTLDLRNVENGEFYVSLPTDGVAQIAALDTVRFNGDTVIQIPIQTTNGLVSMGIFGKGLLAIKTVGGDGDFTIIYNPADSLTPIVYKGTNSEGRALLQQISSERDPYKYEWVRNFAQHPLDTIGNKLADNFEKIASADIAKFDSLLQAGAINKEFYDYAKLDAEVYHALSLGKIIRSDWGTRNRDPKKMYEGYANCWDTIFMKLPLSTDTYRTNNGVYYADLYIRDYLAFCDSKSGAEAKRYNSAMDYNNNILSKADSIFKSEELKKLYIASFIFGEALNNKTRDTSIVEYIDKYTASYPKSRLNSYFNNHKRDLAAYYDKIAKVDMSRVHFVENSDQITTLTYLLSKFKGRKLFVDFWFSSCGPCLNEFEHNANLKKFLDEKGVDILYISIDQPNRENDWMNAIKYNQLHGNHIRTSKTLHEDIYSTHGIYMFPTYMIVDDNSKILVPRAKYPSSGQELLDQLTETLKLQ